MSEKKKRKTLFVIFAVISIAILAAVILVVFFANQPSTAPPLPVSPIMPQYLPYPSGYTSDAYPIGNESRIFLVSANSSYGSYPFSSVESRGQYMPGVQKGDSCFIVNFTVRNDYSLETPVPGLDMAGNHSTNAYIFLTAHIFNSKGMIKATDVTPPYPGVPFGGVFLSIAPGENSSANIFLATSNRDVDHFEVVPEFIGAIPPP